MLDFQLYRRSSKCRNAHFRTLGAAGWSHVDIAAFLRAATTALTTGEILCIVELSEREQARVERRSASADKRMADIAAKYGCSLEWSGDPRGCPAVCGPGLPRTSCGCEGYAID